MLKNHRFLIPIFLSLLGACCPSSGPGADPLSDEDVAAIVSLGPAMDRAALAGDWQGVLDLMTEDVTWIGPNMPPVQGRGACASWLAEADPTFTVHEVELLEVEGRGDLAYAKGPYVETMNLAGMDRPLEDTGHILAIVRKQPDGSWLIAVWMWNSDE